VSAPTPAGPSGAKGRMLRFFTMVALVASLLAVGCYWILRDRGRGAPEPEKRPPAPVASLLRALRLSASSKPAVPSPSPVRFRSGEEIYAHFELEKPCVLFAGLLDSRLGLSALTPDRTAGAAGANVLGPLEVEDTAGREAVLVLASETPRTKDDFLRILGRASDSVRGVEQWFEAKLPAILTALRAHEGLHAEALEYEHVR